MPAGSESERDPTRRFAGRVDDYARHRPDYPPELLPFLEREVGLTPATVVADIGSGTGILARRLLDHGSTVLAVEPNAEMRGVAERALGASPRFRSVAGRAEETGLAPGSADLIVAAQAFHWFRPVEARAEFARILRPGGQVVLIWNTRRVDGTAFERDYEAMIVEFGTDYREVDHRQAQQPERLAAFFAPSSFRRTRFDNAQVLDWNGLRGRLLSSSYVPGPGHPRHEAMLARLRDIFDDHERGGTVRLAYDTEVYHGPLAPR